MKYSLKQHLLGIDDKEYNIVNTHVPRKPADLSEQKAEFVDTKQKSSGLFSAVIAQLVENRGAPRRMNYNFDEIDSDVDKNSFRDANKQRRMMDREESRSGSALNSADGRNPRDHMSNSELAADREWEAEQRGERQAMHGTEEEMETKMTANHDRDMEFQGNISRLNKSTDADNRASTPDNKRLKQRYNRYKRKTWGEEEMEQKIPADRDRVQGIVNRAFGDEAEGDPSIRRRGQRARRRLKADGYKGDRLNAAGRPSEEQEEQRMVASGMDYKFDAGRPQRGATRHQTLPTGRSARSDRAVNNSLRRPKSNIIKDKELDPRIARANDAFKEGDVGNIFAAAFSMINEMGIGGSAPGEDEINDPMEQLFSEIDARLMKHGFESLTDEDVDKVYDMRDHDDDSIDDFVERIMRARTYKTHGGGQSEADFWADGDDLNQ